MTPKLGEIRHLKTTTEQTPIRVMNVRKEGEYTHVSYGYLDSPFASIFTIYDRNGQMIAPHFLTIE